MASKRCLEPVDAVTLTKLPRVEPTTAFLPGKTPGTSSPGSDSHLSYQGSYFSCPVPSPAAARPQHGPATMSQPGPAPAPLLGFLLYPPGLGRPQPPAAHKGQDSPVQEQPVAGKEPEGLRCPLPVTKPGLRPAVPLAVPRPVYGAPACFLAAGVAVPPAPRAESLQQSPGEASWALSPATHPVHPGQPHARGPCSDRGLPPLPPGLVLPPKEQLGSPITLPPCYVPIDKYRPSPSSPFLEGSCPTAQGHKTGPGTPSLSPDPWPKLQGPEAGLANRERPAMCYPPPPYPLSPHTAGPLYHPPAPTAGEPRALPSFGYVGSREPFPCSYLRAQAPRSYFPSPLDTYVPRAAGARLGASSPGRAGALLRDAEPPRDAELPRSPRYPGFAFSPGAGSVFHPSLTGAEPGSEQHRALSPQWRAAPRHSSAFQPVCTSEKFSSGSGGLTETFPKQEGSWERAGPGQQEPPFPGRRSSSPAPPDIPCGGAAAPVSTGRGNACKVEDPARELVPPSPSVTPSKGLEDPRDTKVLSSSPPMPVIHNVFSLAPYQDFLERAKGSDHVLLCRKHLWGDPPPQSMDGSQEPAAPRDTLVVSVRPGSGVVQCQGESSYGSVPKKPKPVPQELESPEGSASGVDSEELPAEDMVLDLSLKKRAMEAEDTQGPMGCVEGTLGQEDKEQQKEAAGGEVEVAEAAQPRPPEVDSGDRSSFQSSATFMFQKYKLLHTLPAGTEPPGQDGSPCPPQPSPPSSTPMPTPPASSPSSSPPVPPPGPQLSTSFGPNPPQTLLLQAPCTPGEEGVCVLRQVGAVPAQAPSGQYFTTLHTWLCDTISGSVSRSPPELLQQWLKKAEPAEELGELPKSLPKPKNCSKAPSLQKASKGKEIWLAFQDVAVLLANLLSQLETFMFSCPFPHVVRAGAVFIPIHVVKEKLFPKLPGSSVDQVLQKHKVELRPTTLSEERHLRDLELKSCTSRMLKLLALKQLPEIYPDLLNLHWHNSIQQQLGSSSKAGQHPSK